MARFAIFILSAILSLAPAIAGAQTIGAFIDSLIWLANRIIGLLFVIATVIFLWGMVRFIAGADNPVQRQKSKGLMVWGIIGMAVMASAWGIAYILNAFFAVPNSAPQFLSPPRMN